MFRFHVLIQNATRQDSKEIPLGYSFSLCGFKALKEGEHVIQHIGKQITIFARFLGSPMLFELVENLWITGTRSFILEPNNMGI